MNYSSAARSVLLALCVFLLASGLSYVDAATLGIAGDSHLWNIAIAVIALGIVYAGVSSRSGETR